MTSRFVERTISGGLLLAFVFLLSRGFLITALGQDHAPAAGTIVLRGLAPVDPAVPRVALPPPERRVTSNGLSTLLLSDPLEPLVTLRFGFRGAGPLYEPAGLEGVAAMTADLLLAGTETAAAGDLVGRFQALGATFSVTAPTGSGETIVEVTGLQRNFEEWFSLTLEVIRRPSFPEAALEALKRNRIEGLRQQSGSLPFALEAAFYRLLYPDHPASRRSATGESLAAISREAIRRWHAERYVPDRATLVVVGDIVRERLAAIVDRSVEGWSGRSPAPEDEVLELPPIGGAATSTGAVPDPGTGRTGPNRAILVDRRGAPQVGFSVGNRTVSRDHPDYVALRVANEILGGGTGLLISDAAGEGSYIAYSQFAAPEYAGPWNIIGVTATTTLSSALDGVIAAIRRIQEGPIDPDELAAVKTALITSFALSLEDPYSRASYAALSESYGLEGDYWNTYMASVEAVDAAEVQRVARIYLDPNAIRVAAVGDAASVMAALERFGPVDIVGEDGAAIRVR